jgi:hypothetical protein
MSRTKAEVARDAIRLAVWLTEDYFRKLPNEWTGFSLEEITERFGKGEDYAREVVGLLNSSEMVVISGPADDPPFSERDPNGPQMSTIADFEDVGLREYGDRDTWSLTEDGEKWAR